MAFGHTIAYSKHVKKRKAHPQKSQIVKEKRGLSPEEIVASGELLDILENKNYPGQTIEVYKIDNYAWAVVVEGERLVSAWPSRKLKKEYLK